MAFTLDQQLEMTTMYRDGLSTVKIGNIFNAPASTVASIVKKHTGALRSNKQNSKRYHCNTRFFADIDTENKAYWLGFIYADGYVSARKDGCKLTGITLGLEDKEHLVKFLAAVDSDHPIRTYQPAGGYSTNPYCRVQIISDEMFTDLVRHGVVEHKSTILKPPTIDEHLVTHFIRGYIDGDGCITYSTPSPSERPSYSLKIVGTDDMLDYIKEFIEKHTTVRILRYYKRCPIDQVSSLEVGGNKQVKAILDHVYGNSSVYLQRKYDRYIELCNLYSRPS